MKKIYVAGVVAAIFFVSCENNGSSTVGSYENEETSSTTDKKEDITSKERSSDNKTENATSVSIDTAKSISGAGKDSLSSHQKRQEHEPVKKM